MTCALIFFISACEKRKASQFCGVDGRRAKGHGGGGQAGRGRRAGRAGRTCRSAPAGVALIISFRRLRAPVTRKVSPLRGCVQRQCRCSAYVSAGPSASEGRPESATADVLVNVFKELFEVDGFGQLLPVLVEAHKLRRHAHGLAQHRQRHALRLCVANGDDLGWGRRWAVKDETTTMAGKKGPGRVA